MRIAFITGSRSDWRLVAPALDAARQQRLDPQLIVTGAHLSSRHGSLVDCIERAGVAPAARVAILGTDDSPLATASATGRAVTGVAEALDQLKPDWTVVVGDRYESFAAGLAATMLGVPLAHVGGGETDLATNQDGNLRNALSKLAQVHFVANDLAAERVLSLGEEPWRVRTVGLPSLDTLYGANPARKLLTDAKLAPADQPFLLVSFLPVTLRPAASLAHLQELLAALTHIAAHKLIVLSNADAAGDEHDALIRGTFAGRSDATLTAALSPEQYVAALAHCACYVGNSSSGVIETPVFGTPTVIVGCRQDGRRRGENVVDCPEPTAEELTPIIEGQMTRGRYEGLSSPYGDGRASRRICDDLVALRGREDLLIKRLCVLETC